MAKGKWEGLQNHDIDHDKLIWMSQQWEQIWYRSGPPLVFRMVLVLVLSRGSWLADCRSLTERKCSVSQKQMQRFKEKSMGPNSEPWGTPPVGPNTEPWGTPPVGSFHPDGKVLNLQFQSNHLKSLKTDWNVSFISWFIKNVWKLLSQELLTKRKIRDAPVARGVKGHPFLTGGDKTTYYIIIKSLLFLRWKTRHTEPQNSFRVKCPLE